MDAATSVILLLRGSEAQIRSGEGTDRGQRRALPREVVDEILAKADGVPLFIEELTLKRSKEAICREMPHSGN